MPLFIHDMYKSWKLVGSCTIHYLLLLYNKIAKKERLVKIGGHQNGSAVEIHIPTSHLLISLNHLACVISYMCVLSLV